MCHPSSGLNLHAVIPKITIYSHIFLFSTRFYLVYTSTILGVCKFFVQHGIGVFSVDLEWQYSLVNDVDEH